MKRSARLGALVAAGALFVSACADAEPDPESAEGRISASQDDATFEPSASDAEPESTSAGTIVTDAAPDDEQPVDEQPDDEQPVDEQPDEVAPPSDDAPSDGGADADGVTVTSSSTPSTPSTPSTGAPSTGAPSTPSTGTDPEGGTERNPDPERRTDDAVIVLADVDPPPENAAKPPTVDQEVDVDDTPGAADNDPLALDQGSALACAVLEIGRDAVVDGDTERAVTLAKRLDDSSDQIRDARLRAVIVDIADADRADLDRLEEGLRRCGDLGYEAIA